MKKDVFKIGDKLELTHVKSAMGRKVSDKKFSSQVLDYDEIRTAKISMPIHENRVIPLELNDEYQICFFTGSGLYQCRARVNKRYAENKMYMLDMYLLTDLEKYQRRKFYRLNCMFTVKYRIVTDGEMLLRKRLEEDSFETPGAREKCEKQIEQMQTGWKEGTISDLSGGGMRFHIREEHEKNQRLEVVLPLSFQKGVIPMKFLLRVLGCTYFEESLTAYEIRGEFEGIKDEERETVIKYVFEEQRRRLRKE